MLPLPDFYEPERVPLLYIERAGLVAQSAEAYARANGIRPAEHDRYRICAFGVDVQVGFCIPGASLFVPGAVEDTQRALRWLYGNLDRISALAFSMDTHRVFQIFHPAYWVDREGRHPPPFTPIYHEEVRAGRWRPVANAALALEYTRKLEATGRYVLTVWPYHALLGGISHALVPAVMEAAIFHAVARRTQTRFETKGTAELTENYSILSPEVTELSGQVVGRFNVELFDTLMQFDRVYLFGQAKSHCVLETLRDMRTRMEATDKKLADKVWILEDAMSPVPPPPVEPLPPHLDFPRVANEGIAELARFGFHVVRTTDPIET